MSESLTVSEFQERLVGEKAVGVVIDIDETLSATNVAWFDRLEKLFGIPPEGLTIQALILKYSYAQNVPHWAHQEAALEWMQSQRDSKDAQKGLPLIPGAVEGVKQLANIVPVLGYLTVRPVSVVEPTLEWLRGHSFPKVPVVSKPNDVPFSKGNEWKGQVLKELFAAGAVTGIVDDNPKVSMAAGVDYPGSLFLFGWDSCPPGVEHAIPCQTWQDVVEEASKRKDQLNHKNTRSTSDATKNTTSCGQEERALEDNNKAEALTMAQDFVATKEG